MVPSWHFFYEEGTGECPDQCAYWGASIKYSLRCGLIQVDVENIEDGGNVELPEVDDNVAEVEGGEGDIEDY